MLSIVATETSALTVISVPGLGARGRKRIEEKLNWDIEKRELIKAYEAALEDQR